MSTSIMENIVIFLILAAIQLSHAVPYSRQNQTVVHFCPKSFMKLGGSCYHFSKVKATWQDAYFYCKDKKSNLTAPERWEDRNIREYLLTADLEKGDRWIGGLYDWKAKAWKWGGELKAMKYQSFSRMPKLSPERLQWHCVAMIPELLYRWSPRLCVEQKYYICQTKLRKLRKNVRNNDKNEVPLPESDIDNDVNPNMSPSNIHYSPKEYYNNNRGSREPTKQSLGKTEFAKRYNARNNTISRKKKKDPFPGYVKIKGNPEATYLYNINALKEGKNGFSKALTDKYLRKLERMRKQEEIRNARRDNIRDQRNRQRNSNLNRTMQDTVLASDVSNIRSRQISYVDEQVHHPNLEFKGLLSYENVTQRTYTMNNQLSRLHPNTIVEIHEVIKKNNT